MKSMLNFKSLPFDFINSSYREDAIQSSQEYCPVESQYKSDSGISNNEGGVVKLTNHNFKFGYTSCVRLILTLVIYSGSTWCSFDNILKREEDGCDMFRLNCETRQTTNSKLFQLFVMPYTVVFQDSTNIQISEGNESTDFVKENYINCITSSCPEETILLPRFYSLTEKPISSSMNSSTDNHYHNPYCEIQSTDHQLNSTINNISYLNTSNYSVNIIPSIKHSDMTSIVHTNSWTLDTRDSLISSPPTLPSLSLPYNNESSLHPIFLMTSNLNYSPTMNQHSTNSSSTTVLIPPVIFDTSNNRNILYNPCSPSTNTSFLLNTNNNIIPDISIIPFNENHFQQENHQQQEE
ncbi:unnamed protein product [Heterobilharzia americana]|nr:unnamed protein product [Heterobilharzia americana]